MSDYDDDDYSYDDYNDYDDYGDYDGGYDHDDHDNGGYHDHRAVDHDGRDTGQDAVAVEWTGFAVVEEIEDGHVEHTGYAEL